MSRKVIVKEAMKTNLAIVTPENTVLDAARLMKERKIGSVIVVEDNHPVGMITESDILRQVVAEDKKANRLCY